MTTGLPRGASHARRGSRSGEVQQRSVRLAAVGAVLTLLSGAAGQLPSTGPAPSSRQDAAAALATARERSALAEPKASRSSRHATPPAAKLPARTTRPVTSRRNTGAAGSPGSIAGGAGEIASIPGGRTMYLGAAGDSPGLSRATGVALSDHAYAHFTGKVPLGRMITVEAAGSWRDVAAAGPGSATYDDIVRWADTIKARGGTIMFAYHHEPEASFDTKLGTPGDFINAFRHVVTIFRARGVRNVIYTWQMTAYAFRAAPSDRRYAANWYPGDAYVDSVGADAYNWNTCGQGSGRWEEFSVLADPVLAFARAHGKQASFPEFASDAGPQRAQWVSNALTYLAAHRNSVTGAFYFQRGPTTAGGADCTWPLQTSAEFAAFGGMARNRSYFMP